MKVVTLSDHEKNDLVATSPDSPQGLLLKAQLQVQLKSLMDIEKAAADEAATRRKMIRETGENLMLLTNKKWFGRKNEFYIGPDVDNKGIILVTGSKANLPIKQMEEDNRRSRLRAKRIKRTYSNSTIITSKLGKTILDPYNV